MLRILGTLDLPLREAISNGKQSVNASLKGKKGDTLDVSYLICGERGGWLGECICARPQDTQILIGWVIPHQTLLPVNVTNVIRALTKLNTYIYKNSVAIML